MTEMLRLVASNAFARVSVIDACGRLVAGPEAGTLSVPVSDDIVEVVVELDGRSAHTVMRCSPAGHREVPVPRYRSAAPLATCLNYDPSHARLLAKLTNKLTKQGVVVLRRWDKTIDGSPSAPPQRARLWSTEDYEYQSLNMRAPFAACEPGTKLLEVRGQSSGSALLVPVFPDHVTQVCLLGRANPSLRAATILTRRIGCGFDSEDPTALACDAAQHAYRLGAVSLPERLRARIDLPLEMLDPMALVVSMWFAHRDGDEDLLAKLRRKLAATIGEEAASNTEVSGLTPDISLVSDLTERALVSAMSPKAAVPTPRLTALAPGIRPGSHWTMVKPSATPTSMAGESAIGEFELRLLKCVKVRHTVEDAANELVLPTTSVVRGAARVLEAAAAAPKDYLPDIRDAAFNELAAAPGGEEPWFWNDAIAKSNPAELIPRILALIPKPPSRHTEKFLSTLLIGFRRDDSPVRWEASAYTIPGMSIDPPAIFPFAIFDRYLMHDISSTMTPHQSLLRATQHASRRSEGAYRRAEGVTSAELLSVMHDRGSAAGGDQT